MFSLLLRLTKVVFKIRFQWETVVDVVEFLRARIHLLFSEIAFSLCMGRCNG